MTSFPSRREYLAGLGTVGTAAVAGCSTRKIVERELASPGDHAWTFAAGTDETLFPAVAEGTVYAGSTGGALYAVEYGSQQWTFETAGPIRSPPVVVEATVVVGDTEGTLYGVDAATGEQQWTHSLAGPVVSSPVESEGIVYVGANELYAIDAAAGTEQWMHSGDASIRSPAVLRETDTVYAGSSGGSVYAVDAADGSELWTREVGGPASLAPTVRAEEGVVGATDSTVFALKWDTGERDWRHAVNVDDQHPIYMDGYVYAAGDGNSLYNVGTDTGKWPYVTDATITSQIAGRVTHGAVYVGDESGRFASVEFIDGTEQWSTETDGVVRSAPAIGSGTVYVGTDTGQLHALVEKDP